MSEERPVSVIVCTLNRAESLSRLIEILKVQDYPRDKYEIIIVDNGSTDQTKSVVEGLMKQPGAKIRYTLESQRGVTFARNRGLELARFPFLAYIDDDCTVGSEWLRSLMHGYNLDERIFVVFGRIINEWREQVKPRWMIPETEIWLGNNSFLGSSSRILKDGAGTREGNLSIKKETLKSLGGFLGMEKFGSRDMAAAELRYCLWQAKKRGAKIAFVPEAVAHHHVVARSRSWMLGRAYWQGISDGILEHIIYRRKSWSLGIRVCLDLAAMIVLLALVIFYMILLNQPKWMFHLLRAVRRFGLILSEVHLKGDRSQIDIWLEKHPL